MLTAAALAAHLGISERQVQRLAAAGLPWVPIGTRGKRYDADECKRWLRENYGCRSSEARPGAGTSMSASTANAFTDACRKVQVRVMPSGSKPNSEPRSAGEPIPLSLVTPA